MFTCSMLLSPVSSRQRHIRMTSKKMEMWDFREVSVTRHITNILFVLFENLQLHYFTFPPLKQLYKLISSSLPSSFVRYTTVFLYSMRPILTHQYPFNKPKGLNISNYVVKTNVTAKAFSDLMKAAVVTEKTQDLPPR